MVFFLSPLHLKGPVVFEVSPIFDLNPEPPAEWKQKPYRESKPQILSFFLSHVFSFFFFEKKKPVFFDAVFFWVRWWFYKQKGCFFLFDFLCWPWVFSKMRQGIQPVQVQLGES